MSKRRTSRACMASSLFLLTACAIALPATSASAQGLFEALFGGFRRAIQPPPQINSYADPQSRAYGPGYGGEMRVDQGPSSAYCVRTCDGRYFPVRNYAGASAADLCKSFCPATATKVFNGSKIDYAVASNGERYSDLDNAFVYRERIVDNCTCNGKDAFGLVRIDVRSDPTLRPGDIVATGTGLAAFTGNKNDQTANFTPITDFASFPKNHRDKLSQIKVMPRNPGADNSPPVTFRGNSRDDNRRRVYLSR